MRIVIFCHLTKAINFVKGGCHVVIFKSHRRLEESFKLESVVDDLLLHAPAAEVGIPFIDTPPNLKFLIDDPNALVFPILRNAI